MSQIIVLTYLLTYFPPGGESQSFISINKQLCPTFVESRMESPGLVFSFEQFFYANESRVEFSQIQQVSTAI